MSGSAKSNRSKADVFELAVTELTADAFRVPFSYEDKKAEAHARLLAAHPQEAAAMRVKEEQRARAVSEDIVALVAGRAASGLGAVAGVEWTGNRKDGTDDIVIIHGNGTSPFSLKSVARKSGTSRNAGGTTLKRLLGIDVPARNGAMYAEVIAGIAAVDPARGSALKRLGIRARGKALTADEADFAVRVGRAFTAQLSRDARKALLCDPIKASAFVAYMSAATHSREEMFLVVVNDKERYIKRAPKAQAFAELQVVMNAGDGASGFTVRAADAEVLRVQFSCTNGLGISPLCARGFA